MGNQPSSAANYQLTPEQYQQYQYFLHQQQMQQQQQQYKMGQAQQQRPTQPRPPQQQPQMASRATPATTTNYASNLQSNFIQQQQQRSQVRPTNQRMDAKIIPNLQQKSRMPSVENSYQSAYNQRLNDNFNHMGNAQPPSMHGMRNLNTPQQQPYESTRSKPVPESKPKQQSFFNNLNNEINEIEHLKYNPEQILGLTEGVAHNELEIKKAYRNLALKYHPDKGGSEEIFKILTKAYLYLLKKTNGDTYVEKSFMDLKGNFEREHPSSAASHHQAPRTSSDDFNVKNFNKIFEDNRLENEDFDYGYGDWKTENTSEEPQKIFNEKFTADVFNSVFNELKKKNSTAQDVIVYEDPKPLTVSNRFGYSEVDYKRSDDYSKEYDIQDGSSRQGIYYMDYKRAYTETTLINPEAVRSKEQFKNIEDAKHAREKQDFTMTDEERAYFADKKRREDEQEEQRLSRLRGRDNQLEQHSNAVNRLLMTNQPQSTRTLEYKK